MSIPNLDITTSESAKKFLKYVTAGFYDNSYIGLWLFQVLGIEADEMRLWTEDVREQAYPQTATWSLPHWEYLYLIEPDDSLTLEQRRARLIAAIQTRAPINPAVLERHAEGACFGQAKAAIEEFVESYTFLLRLSEISGPIDYSWVIQEVSRIKPSHLKMEFEVDDGIKMDTVYVGVLTMTHPEYHLTFSSFSTEYESASTVYAGVLPNMEKEYTIKWSE